MLLLKNISIPRYSSAAQDVRDMNRIASEIDAMIDCDSLTAVD